ncbi:uncharacterized protein BXZ73DRAFT_100711 [Epithele typhae]|uniref:uncharacterized protein n=1 Tax=Epithele typhae TaxID=378194 RepID=UPI002008B81E|nr:uncharacterized protein BXZ73DRAFT_100711 [Epithele typhae]KAH9934521.1 hypothetical protein BXZ73DRAFT_100711 [Epithele typhae]
MAALSTVKLVLVHVLSWLATPRLTPRDINGIHLAVHPVCGTLSGHVVDVNAGVDLGLINTVVAFGDSYTDGGRDDGGPLAPPVVIPPDALAGGRSTNGKVWVEHLSDDIGATLMDYAQSGACTDLRLWPSNYKKVDFLGQMSTFLGQNNSLAPGTTLYAVFFGINDFGDSRNDCEESLQAAAQVILEQIRILASPPTNGRSFLVLDDYGIGTHTAAGDAFVQTVFSGLRDLHDGINSTTPFTPSSPPPVLDAQRPLQAGVVRGPRLNVAFASLSRIWDGVLGPDPGYEAFGYRSTDACITQCSLLFCSVEGMCDDPEHYFSYIPSHPSKEGMRIMADYVKEVMNKCVVG